MRKFLGIVFGWGLVRYPTIKIYWSTRPIYENNLIPKIDFKALLRFWHFSNNEDMVAEDNRLHKIDPLICHFNLRYKEVMQTGKVIAVDESMVPFRGRLKFRQYIPGKCAIKKDILTHFLFIKARRQFRKGLSQQVG